MRSIAAFWPVYDRYAAELEKAGELRVRAVTNFAGNEAKLVRLYQVEHRIDTIMDYALAREIPLAISP